MPSVDVLLEFPGGGQATQTQTTASGSYVFAQIAEQAWTIEPSLVGHLDGSVNATDAARILSAVTGEITLTPGEIVVADVSGDGSVSSTDAALILQRATGMISSFPVTDACSSDWVFFPAPAAPPLFGTLTVTQPDVSTDRCVPGSITLDPLVGQVENLDFNAVAFGDVDGSWVSVRAGEGALNAAITLGRPLLRGAASAQVPIALAPRRQFRGLHLVIDYDPEVAVFVAIRPATEARPVLVVANDREAGRLVIGAASATPIDAEQPFSLEFATVQPGTYPDVWIVEGELDPL